MKNSELKKIVSQYKEIKIKQKKKKDALNHSMEKRQNV